MHTRALQQGKETGMYCSQHRSYQRQDFRRNWRYPPAVGGAGRVHMQVPQALIREVIAAHPQDYASADGWQEQAVAALVELVPFAYQQLLSELFVPTDGGRGDDRGAPAPEAPDRRRLGF